MVQFDHSSQRHSSQRHSSQRRPIPYLNRNSQLRMLGMLGGLVFILVAMQWAARPQSWYWLVPPQPKMTTESQASPMVNADSKNASQDDKPQLLSPGQFLATINSDKKTNNDKKTSDAETQKSKPKKTNTQAEPLEGEASREELLALIDDNYVGIREKEVPALFELLNDAIVSSPGELYNQRKTGLNYQHFIAEPEKHRAEVILLKGQLVRLSKMTVPRNTNRWEHLYDLWILTEDSGNDLYRVLTPNLPEGLSVEQNLSQPVAVKCNAIFFKRFAYESVNGKRQAPLFLTPQLTNIQVVDSPLYDQSLVPFLLGGFVVLLVIIVLVFRFFNKEDSQYRAAEKQRRQNALPSSMEGIEVDQDDLQSFQSGENQAESNE